MKMTTSEIANRLVRYYGGARKVLHHGRFRSLNWAVRQVLDELRSSHR